MDYYYYSLFSVKDLVILLCNRLDYYSICYLRRTCKLLSQKIDDNAYLYKRKYSYLEGIGIIPLRYAYLSLDLYKEQNLGYQNDGINIDKRSTNPFLSFCKCKLNNNLTQKILCPTEDMDLDYAFLPIDKVRYSTYEDSILKEFQFLSRVDIRLARWIYYFIVTHPSYNKSYNSAPYYGHIDGLLFNNTLKEKMFGDNVNKDTITYINNIKRISYPNTGYHLVLYEKMDIINYFIEYYDKNPSPLLWEDEKNYLINIFDKIRDIDCSKSFITLMAFYIKNREKWIKTWEKTNVALKILFDINKLVKYSGHWNIVEYLLFGPSDETEASRYLYNSIINCIGNKYLISNAGARSGPPTITFSIIGRGKPPPSTFFGKDNSLDCLEDNVINQENINDRGDITYRLPCIYHLRSLLLKHSFLYKSHKIIPYLPGKGVDDNTSLRQLRDNFVPDASREGNLLQLGFLRHTSCGTTLYEHIITVGKTNTPVLFDDDDS